MAGRPVAERRAYRPPINSRPEVMRVDGNLWLNRCGNGWPVWSPLRFDPTGHDGRWGGVRLELSLQQWAVLVHGDQCGVEIVPMRVVAFDQIDLPFALVALDRCLALDRRFHVRMPFVPDEAMKAI